ncbi:MAG: flavodoxin/nitric oxide synthase [Clostridiales bacterium]|jgi:flavodoxin|nr:flavodoxin/nitric oxide synthase [Clostridiales bacterium]
MKVGIIVHSHTGHTLSVAQKLKEVLVSAGHLVNLEQVKAVNEDPSAAKNIQLKTKPDIVGYDVLIFGAPVHGFSLSPVMKAYLAQISTLQGKKVGCFLTEYFPLASMGGNRAMGEFKKACEDKGGNVFQTAIVNWSMGQREKKTANALEKLGKL